MPLSNILFTQGNPKLKNDPLNYFNNKSMFIMFILCLGAFNNQFSRNSYFTTV